MAAEIPNSFERYRQLREAKAAPHGEDFDPSCCTSCARQVPRVTGDGYCDTCLHYSWGYDQAEEKVARAMIAAAVRGALLADIEPATIVTAVQEAIEEHTLADLGLS